MRRLVRLIAMLNRGCGAVAAALVLVLMGLMGYEVALRYIFGTPTMWSYEVSTMTMGAIFVLSIGYALESNAHVRVDILHPLLGPFGKIAIDLVGHAFIMLPLLAWLCFGLWDYFYGAWATMERTGTSAWNPIVWPFRAILFLGAVAWTLQELAEVIKNALALTGRARLGADGSLLPD